MRIANGKCGKWQKQNKKKIWTDSKRPAKMSERESELNEWRERMNETKHKRNNFMYWNTLCDLFIRIPKFFTSKNYMIFCAAHWRLEIPQQHFSLFSLSFVLKMRTAASIKWSIYGFKENIIHDYVHTFYCAVVVSPPPPALVFDFIRSPPPSFLPPLFCLTYHTVLVLHARFIKVKWRWRRGGGEDGIPHRGRWNFCSDRFSTFIWFNNWLCSQRLFRLSFIRKWLPKSMRWPEIFEINWWNTWKKLVMMGTSIIAKQHTRPQCVYGIACDVQCL